MCTSYLAAVYLKEQNFTKKAYVIGSEGITKEFDAQGIKYCGLGVNNLILYLYFIISVLLLYVKINYTRLLYSQT